ncbi:hypothetical protein AB205_0119960 [Aquarana catesbeiana]|uniref:G-protein coupled receptors family 1 profile domain-containing protein n=1 Tax=Aquarana catesbeiana TaxID=8400 RepID=A0A2G9PMF2_AQUCT|nr:hypothetical protein AB205_0119960 [Aquarana catesbeiana]
MGTTPESTWSLPELFMVKIELCSLHSQAAAHMTGSRSVFSPMLQRSKVLTAIHSSALDVMMSRYMAIIHPLKPRLSATATKIVICVIWSFSFCMAFPLGYYADVYPMEGGDICYLNWPDSEENRKYEQVIFRQQMFDGSLLSEILTMCRLHQTFSVGISDKQNLRSGSQIFRQQNPLSEISIVCTQFRCTKFYACSESSRIGALAIELNFSRLVVRLVRHRVLDVRNFRQHLCDRVYARQV